MSKGGGLLIYIIQRFPNIIRVSAGHGSHFQYANREIIMLTKPVSFTFLFRHPIKYAKVWRWKIFAVEVRLYSIEFLFRELFRCHTGSWIGLTLLYSIERILKSYITCFFKFIFNSFTYFKTPIFMSCAHGFKSEFDVCFMLLRDRMLISYPYDDWNNVLFYLDKIPCWMSKWYHLTQRHDNIWLFVRDCNSDRTFKTILMKFRKEVLRHKSSVEHFSRRSCLTSSKMVANLDKWKNDMP